MDDPRTELPQRRTFAHLLVAAAAVMAVPTVATAFDAGTAEAGTALVGWAMAVVMGLALVVVPLLLVRSILVRHTYVSEDAVTIVAGGEVQQQLAFVDVTEVKVRFSGRGGDTFRNEKVFLAGTLREGRGTVLVSRFHVDTLQPLLARLAAEVEQRPELLSGDVARAYFEHPLRTTPEGGDGGGCGSGASWEQHVRRLSISGSGRRRGDDRAPTRGAAAREAPP